MLERSTGTLPSAQLDAMDVGSIGQIEHPTEFLRIVESSLLQGLTSARRKEPARSTICALMETFS
jgi:hypothetical protein